MAHSEEKCQLSTELSGTDCITEVGFSKNFVSENISEKSENLSEYDKKFLNFRLIIVKMLCMYGKKKVQPDIF